MILNTTYTERDQEERIDNLVGKKFGFIETLKLKGIGSKRMIINKASNKIESLLNKSQDINYVNIELRPKGVLLRIHATLKTYAWVIPYYQLVVFKSLNTSIHAQGQFIQFKQDNRLRDNKGFFQKMMDQRLLCTTMNHPKL
ncbi:hypothetical protein [Xanthomarina gelatinilytica]|jgi:hypothetical protein|uniref:hypothetical protein n=1 Tax=Xanthomarina gelatinilytica TaxID=1137281 RepID=UPI003AA912C5